MTDFEDTIAILLRLRRKIEIKHMDAKARQCLSHDYEEMLSLLDMLERKLK